MAKFCTKCGKKLEKDQVCDCEAKEEKVVSEKTEPFDFGKAMNQYLEVAKGIFTHPIDTIKKYATEKYFVLGLIMILINSLVMGLFVWLVAKEMVSSVAMLGELFGSGMYDLGDLYELGEVQVPISVLIKAAVFGIVGFASTAGMLYLIAGPIMKGKETIKQLFSLVGVCSVLTTITTLIACALMYISVQVTVIFMLLAAVLYFAYLYHGLVETTTINKNRLGYAYIATLAVSSFVIFYILPKILF